MGAEETLVQVGAITIRLPREEVGAEGYLVVGRDYRVT